MIEILLWDPVATGSVKIWIFPSIYCSVAANDCSIDVQTRLICPRCLYRWTCVCNKLLLAALAWIRVGSIVMASKIKMCCLVTSAVGNELRRLLWSWFEALLFFFASVRFSFLLIVVQVTPVTMSCESSIAPEIALVPALEAKIGRSALHNHWFKRVKSSSYLVKARQCNARPVHQLLLELECVFRILCFCCFREHS